MNDATAPMSIVWELPTPSSHFASTPRVIIEGDRVLLELEDPTGVRVEVRFGGVAGFRHDPQLAASPEAVASYDRILEIRDSGWPDPSLQERRARLTGRQVPLRHFRLYLDDIGVFDVLAESLELPT